jgi:hypothetical protein
MKLFDFFRPATRLIILFNVVSVIFILSIISYIPIEPLVSYETADNNGASCPYYFTLQSLLTSYPQLSGDKANLKYIKDRLVRFERKMRKPTPSFLINDYKVPYYNSLAALNLTSINQTKSPSAIIKAATQTFPIVDKFYLDTRIYCRSTYFEWGSQSRRILRYNLNGMYDLAPPYSRVLMATTTDWITGNSPGLFVLNQNETLDTRFMTGLPLLSALYVLPKSKYTHYGFYDSPGNWRYFNSVKLRDPVIRKVMDISGNDIFTFFKSDLKKTTLPDTSILPSKIDPLFGNAYVSLINNKSYGIAYMANAITYEDTAVANQYENTVKQYFADHQDVTAFSNTTDAMYNKLMQLKAKHDVILEAPDPLASLNATASDQPKGSVDIKRILAERALFNTKCLDKNCLFVFNMGLSPGWKAYVNGKESKIMRVNYSFMATEVPEGEATVWFIYASQSQLITYFISVFTLLFIILTTAFYQRKPQDEPIV